MDKLILRKIAQDWCKGIIEACGGDTFTDEVESGVLTEEEVDYILKEAVKVAERITDRPTLVSTDKIVSRYYEIE